MEAWSSSRLCYLTVCYWGYEETTSVTIVVSLSLGKKNSNLELRSRSGRQYIATFVTHIVHFLFNISPISGWYIEYIAMLDTYIYTNVHIYIVRTYVHTYIHTYIPIHTYTYYVRHTELLWYNFCNDSIGVTEFFCSSKRPDQIWGPPNLLFHAYRVYSGQGMKLTTNFRLLLGVM